MSRKQFSGVMYACGVDWQHELGDAIDGTTFYPSLEWIKKLRSCVSGCGVVRVQVTAELLNWAEPQDLGKSAKRAEEWDTLTAPKLSKERASEILAGALKTVEKLCEVDPPMHSPEADLLSAVACAVEAYEKKYFPIGEEAKPVSTPYVGYSNASLAKCPKVVPGQYFRCEKCARKHRLQTGKNRSGSSVLMFYRCKGASYLGAVDGKLIVDIKPDVSGDL